MLFVCLNYAIIHSDQITTTVFQETPPMPTYLVAFVVSDFAVLSNTNKFGFVQRVFARSTAIADGQFALEMGHRTLTAYEKYFGIPFALPKMDQVAIPVLSFTAMENWGLIIYKEPYLLYNTSHNSFAEERQVAVTITHEFAHQYFGNLVTPKWWSNVWLSEGFANLFENIAADWVCIMQYLKPEVFLHHFNYTFSSVFSQLENYGHLRIGCTKCDACRFDQSHPPDDILCGCTSVCLQTV